MPNKEKRPTAAEASRGIKTNAKKVTKTNRPKDADKSNAGKASAAARKAKRESGEPIKRPCTARRSDGSACGNSAIRGGTVCVAHGGRAPQVRAKANMRLLNMVEPALKELRRIIDDANADDANKLRAINMVLNRTGFAEKQNLEIGLRPPTVWDQITEGSVFEFDRGELEVEPAPDRRVLGGGDDLDTALDDMLNRRDRDKEREASTRINHGDHDVVTGEVVEDPHPTKPAERGGYRGRTTRTGPVEFPTSDPRNAGATEYDPQPAGRRRGTQRDLYEDPEDA